MKRIIGVIYIVGACFLFGCNRSPETGGAYNLVIVTNRNAIVYELNKTNGDLALVSGTEYTRLKENIPLDQTNTPATEWTQSMQVQDGTNTANLKISLKHKWQNGFIYYIFTVDHYSDFFSQKLALGAHADFHLKFFDSDGFDKRSVDINFSQANLVSVDGNTVLTENSSAPCSLAAYQEYKSWSVSWQWEYTPPPPILSDDAWIKEATEQAFHTTNHN